MTQSGSVGVAEPKATAARIVDGMRSVDRVDYLLIRLRRLVFQIAYEYFDRERIGFRSPGDSHIGARVSGRGVLGIAVLPERDLVAVVGVDTRDDASPSAQVEGVLCAQRDREARTSWQPIAIQIDLCDLIGWVGLREVAHGDIPVEEILVVVGLQPAEAPIDCEVLDRSSQQIEFDSIGVGGWRILGDRQTVFRPGDLGISSQS